MAKENNQLTNDTLQYAVKHFSMLPSSNLSIVSPDNMLDVAMEGLDMASIKVPASFMLSFILHVKSTYNVSFDKDATLYLLKLSAFASLESLHNYTQVLEDIIKKEFTPLSGNTLYKDFPQSVMNATQAELYFNAIYHYMTGDPNAILEGIFVRSNTKAENIPSDYLSVLNAEPNKVFSIREGNYIYDTVVNALVSSSTRLSPDDSSLLFRFCMGWEGVLSKQQETDSVLKETSAIMVVGMLVNRYRWFSKQEVTNSIGDIINSALPKATLKDLMRIILAFNYIKSKMKEDNLDFPTVAFDNVTKIISIIRLEPYVENENDYLYTGKVTDYTEGTWKNCLSTSEANAFNKVITGIIGSSIDDKQRLAELVQDTTQLWKRYLMTTKYNKNAKAINSLRDFVFSGENYSINSIVEKCLETGDLDSLLIALSDHPSMLVRRINQIYNSGMTVTSSQSYRLLTILRDADLRVLLQAYNGFHRNSILPDDAKRIVRYGSKTIITEKPASTHGNDDIIRAILCSAIVAKLGDTPLIRKVLDNLGDGDIVLPDKYKGIAIETSSDSNNSASTPMPIGSTLKLPVITRGKALQLYVHWTNSDQFNNTDIDLSVQLFNRHLGSVGHVGFTNLRQSSIVHSGDLTNAPAPDGATEIIRIPLEATQGISYIVPLLISFSGETMDTIGDVTFGWGLVDMDSPIDPKIDPTQFTSATIKSASTTVVPTVINLEASTITWVDISGNVLCAGNVVTYETDFLKEVVNYANASKNTFSISSLVHYMTIDSNSGINVVPKAIKGHNIILDLSTDEKVTSFMQNLLSNQYNS